MRSLTIVMVFAMVAFEIGTSFAQQSSGIKVGDTIRLRLTDEVATAWYKHLGDSDFPTGLQIETNVRVAAVLNDGSVRVMMTWAYPRDAKTHRIPTLTTTTVPSKLIPYHPIEPSSHVQERNPGVPKPKTTKQPTFLLVLSKRDDVTLGRTVVKTKAVD